MKNPFPIPQHPEAGTPERRKSALLRVGSFIACAALSLGCYYAANTSVEGPKKQELVRGASKFAATFMVIPVFLESDDRYGVNDQDDEGNNPPPDPPPDVPPKPFGPSGGGLTLQSLDFGAFEEYLSEQSLTSV
jgi:hypothetical protein